MSNTKTIEWVNGREEGYAGRRARVRVWESHPRDISWKCEVEELVQLPGQSSHLVPTGRKLAEGAPTRDGARALAVLLVARLLADVPGVAA